MNIPLVNKLRSLILSLGAHSISIGTGSSSVVLTCIPAHLESLDTFQEIGTHMFEKDFLDEHSIDAVRVMFASPNGIASMACNRENPSWSFSERIPGVYNPVFSLMLSGIHLGFSSWMCALGLETGYLNCRPVGGGLPFEVADARGIVVHDDTVEAFTLVNGETVTTFQQTCHLMEWVMPGVNGVHPLRLIQGLSASQRSKFLKTNQDFSPSELGASVDLEGLKSAVQNPQDLAALLGLGIRLKPDLDRGELEWSVDRYLLEPVVLQGYDTTACIESGLPIAPEGLAPDWVPRFTPEIQETLPKKLLRTSAELGVLLVDEIRTGELRLPYLLMQPENKINGGGREQNPRRPVLLIARYGRKAAAIVADLMKRILFLGTMARLFGDQRLMERQQIVVQRYPYQLDSILAALWLVSQAQNLSRGEASSLGHLRRSALGVSITLRNEIEALRKKKPEKDTDLALVRAIEALDKNRDKLIARLEKAAHIEAAQELESPK